MTCEGPASAGWGSTWNGSSSGVWGLTWKISWFMLLLRRSSFKLMIPWGCWFWPLALALLLGRPHPLPCCTWVAYWDGCVRNINKTMIVKVVLVLTWTKVGWPKLGWGIGSTGGGVLPCLWAQWWSGAVICRWERCSCSRSDAWWCSGVFGVWYLMNITMSVWHRSNHNNYWHGAQNTEMVIVGISRQTEYWDWDDKSLAKSSLAKFQVQFSLANTIYETLHAGVATTGMNGDEPPHQIHSYTLLFSLFLYFLYIIDPPLRTPTLTRPHVIALALAWHLHLLHWTDLTYLIDTCFTIHMFYFYS